MKMDESNEIVKVLTLYSKGQTKGHDSLVSYLTDPGLTDQVLLKCVQSFKECVSLLGKEFEYLMGALLKVNWLYRSPQVAKEYQSFMLHLVSAHPFYVIACLRMLVNWFIPVIPTGYEASALEGPVEQVLQDVHSTAFDRVHELLEAVIKLVPLSPNQLMTILTKSYPYIGRPAYIQACYVRNALRLTSFMRLHRGKILAIVVEHMIILDVRAPRNHIEDVESLAEEELVLDDSDDSNSDMEELDIVQPHNHADNHAMSHPEADKLDNLMELLMKYIYEVCHPNDVFNLKLAETLYADLQGVFLDLLLPTHATCHVQFIIFYVLSFHPKFVRYFLNAVWAQVSSPNQQRIFRQAAAAYMGSILARAQFIGIKVKAIYMDIMANWLHHYLANTNDSCTDASPVYHGPFYSICQALIYSVTFNLKDLLELQDGYTTIDSLKLQTIVTSRLNPLRFCQPVIARTFCSDMRSHQICYCDSIMEHNRRNQLPHEIVGNKHQERLSPVDAFFPFDPYLLSKSCRFIVPLYQEYKGKPVVEDSDLIAQGKKSKRRNPLDLDEGEINMYDMEDSRRISESVDDLEIFTEN